MGQPRTITRVGLVIRTPFQGFDSVCPATSRLVMMMILTSRRGSCVCRKPCLAPSRAAHPLLPFGYRTHCARHSRGMSWASRSRAVHQAHRDRVEKTNVEYFPSEAARTTDQAFSRTCPARSCRVLDATKSMSWPLHRGLVERSLVASRIRGVPRKSKRPLRPITACIPAFPCARTHEQFLLQCSAEKS